jgi:hypothetical protein
MLWNIVFLDIGLLLTMKLLNQWFLLVKLKSSLRKFYGRHHDLVDSFGTCVTMTYKWKAHNGKIEIISFVVKFRS